MISLKTAYDIVLNKVDDLEKEGFNVTRTYVADDYLHQQRYNQSPVSNNLSLDQHIYITFNISSEEEADTLFDVIENLSNAFNIAFDISGDIDKRIWKIDHSLCIANDDKIEEYLNAIEELEENIYDSKRNDTGFPSLCWN